MPAAPILPMVGLPSLTSSELYTQILAAQADVLAAAQAWPLLAKSLSDLTDIPDRQQLAIGRVRWRGAGCAGRQRAWRRRAVGGDEGSGWDREGRHLPFPSSWRDCLDAWLWLWLHRMGPSPKTRGGGLVAGTQQQGELGLPGGVQGLDEMLQS